MSFAEWKNRSKLYQAFKNRAGRYGIGYEEVARAAYKAGERDGLKQRPLSSDGGESTAQSSVVACRHEYVTGGYKQLGDFSPLKVACPTDKEK